MREIYILFSFLFLQLITAQWLPKIVWTYWHKPLEQENHFIKALHGNHINNLKTQGWQLRHLNEKNLMQWMQPITKFKQGYAHPFYQQLTKAQQADLIRIALLSYYGGVYMDMSLFLTEGLNWLNNLKDLSYVENVYGDQPNFFYVYARHTDNQRYFDIESGRSFLIIPSIQVFFMAAKQGFSFLQEWLNFAVYTKIQSYQKYRNYDKASVFVDIAKQQQIHIGEFNQRYYEMSVAGIILLARKQKQFDQIWGFHPLKIRQLVVKELKIWVTNSDNTAYMYMKLHEGFIRPLVSLNQEIFAIKQKITPFVKFWHKTYEKMLKFFETQFANCSKQFYIVNSSILYQHVLKPYPIKFYNNSIYTIQQYHKECTPQGHLEQVTKKIEQKNKELSNLLESSNLLQNKINQLKDQRVRKNQEVGKIGQEKEVYVGIVNKMKKDNQFFKNLKDQNLDNEAMIVKMKEKLSQLNIQSKKNDEILKSLQQKAQLAIKQSIKQNTRLQESKQKILSHVKASEDFKNSTQYNNSFIKDNQYQFIAIFFLTVFAVFVYNILIKMRQVIEEEKHFEILRISENQSLIRKGLYLKRSEENSVV